MPDPDCTNIRRQLQLYPGSKLGFVLYRLTYTDDAQWEKFMYYLNTRIRLGLEEDGEGDLFQHVDWNVQEDLELQDADDDEVRARFKKYLDGHEDSRHGSRAMACIAVTQMIMDHVLEHGPAPEKFDASAITCVDMISVDSKQGSQLVGLSFVFPRAYSLMKLGWHQIAGKGIFGN